MASAKNGSQGKPAVRWRFWLPRVAFAIVAPILLLALTEAALRLFHVGYSTDLMEPCAIHGRPSSCYNLFFAAPFFPPGMIKTPQFFSIDPVKPKVTYRIVILGESAAMGDPDFAYGFGRYLEVMLGQRFPGANFEVVNTGIVAINSHVIRSIAEQIGGYEPDLFISYIGNNEVVGPYGPGTTLTSGSLSLPVIRTSIFVRSSRLGQLLTTEGKPPQQWAGMEMFLDKQVRANSQPLEQTYKNFSTNLLDIVNSARKAHAPMFLCTVASNVRDSAPFGSLHDPRLSAGALQSWSGLFQQGIALEAEQSYSEALKHYASASQIDNQYAELEFRIARCYRQLGEFAAAKEHYIRARDLDTLRFRADSQINDIIRATAKSEARDVVLLDTEALLAGESQGGVVGSELMYDHVHLTPLGNYLIAKALFPEVVKSLPGLSQNASASNDPLTETECERLLALTAHDRSRVAAEMADRMQRPPFTKQLNHAEQMQGLILRAAGPAESPQDTFAQYRWAIAQRPNDLTLHYKFGFFLFDYDRNAAAQQLVLARPNDDFPVFLPDGTRIQ